MHVSHSHTAVDRIVFAAEEGRWMEQVYKGQRPDRPGECLLLTALKLDALVAAHVSKCFVLQHFMRKSRSGDDV